MLEGITHAILPAFSGSLRTVSGAVSQALWHPGQRNGTSGGSVDCRRLGKDATLEAVVAGGVHTSSDHQSRGAVCWELDMTSED